MTTNAMDFKYAVALTGGIATGKSTVASIMSALGYRIIDADTIAHEVLDSQRRQIGELFGEELVADTKVNRKALGAIVFADTKKRKQLEALVHPLIQAEIETQAIEFDKLSQPYLVDIPLFYERGAYDIDKVLVVYAPRELQIARLMERNGLSKAEALLRLDAQMDIDQKRTKARYLIENTSTIEHLERECKRVHDEIAADFGYNITKNG